MTRRSIKNLSPSTGHFTASPGGVFASRCRRRSWRGCFWLTKGLALSPGLKHQLDATLVDEHRQALAVEGHELFFRREQLNLLAVGTCQIHAVSEILSPGQARNDCKPSLILRRDVQRLTPPPGAGDCSKRPCRVCYSPTVPKTTPAGFLPSGGSYQTKVVHTWNRPRLPFPCRARLSR